MVVWATNHDFLDSIVALPGGVPRMGDSSHPPAEAAKWQKSILVDQRAASSATPTRCFRNRNSRENRSFAELKKEQRLNLDRVEPPSLA